MKVKDLCTYAPKSKIKAGEATENGKYMFFTSSTDESKRYDDFQLDCEGIIMGTGGNATLHYYNGKYSVSTDCIVLLPNDSVRCKYLYYYFLSHMKTLEEGFKGAGLKHTNKKYISDIEVGNIPSLETQNKILYILDKISQIIDQRKQQLEKLDELIKYRFVEMFGDPEINSKCWNIQSLAEHLNVVGGYAFKSDEFVEHGIPILRIGNINTGHFKPTNLVFWNDTKELYRYKIYPGDLVMSLTGTVGKNDYGNVCILGNDYNEYYLNQRNAKLELKNTINKYYLLQLLKFNIIKEKLTGISRGVRQANISNKDILNLTVPIPPIDLQNKFELFVKQVDKSKVIVMNILKILYQRVTL